MKKKEPRTLDELRGVKVADMTAEEQRIVIRSAINRLQREVETNADKILRILGDVK